MESVMSDWTLSGKTDLLVVRAQNAVYGAPGQSQPVRAHTPLVLVTTSDDVTTHLLSPRPGSSGLERSVIADTAG
jgi:hypothetical protein